MDEVKIIEDSFLNSENALYITQQFKVYKEQPHLCSAEWKAFFQQLGDDEQAILLDLSRGSKYIGSQENLSNTLPNLSVMADTKDMELSLKAATIADAYRRWGHYSANLDPLGLIPPKGHIGLSTKAHTLTDKDLDTSIKGFKLGRRETLRGIIEQLTSVYCGNIGYEYMHLPNMDEVNWIKRRLETAPFALTAEDELEIFEGLVKTEVFEQFLGKKFPGAKRFGIEGCDALIPLVHDILNRAAADELGHVIIGMSHRGRLNALYNIMERPYEEIFAKFMNKVPPGQGSGDVKYHIGAHANLNLHQHKLDVSLLYNPSHLEAINPVAMGYVWSKQQKSLDALGILIHGDAAFSGQGVNAETFLLSQVQGYSVKGMIHIIANNQVGFTANPTELRSTDYASDLAKSINAPIFHVNADDIEACIFVAWLAYSYRQEFKKDVVIDIVGYRRYGHNEGDEPNFTQPLMYTTIRSHPSVLTRYENFLINKHTLTKEKANQIRSIYEERLATAYNKAEAWTFEGYHHFHHEITTLDSQNRPTGVDRDQLKEIGSHLSKVSNEFNLNPKIDRQFTARQQMMDAGTNIDWATAELLAYGSLLRDGYPVRISGEDCVRGTFSHRHIGVYDQSTNEQLFPINTLPGITATLSAYNSVLSEYAVMGFEYGVSLENPNQLVIWEAQFGDFANGAQIIIDQFIASAETKWGLNNRLVLLLPHGLEGQGPEHSSARLERFLQLCADENICVIHPTTPANIFHGLRRQMYQSMGKPLIVMTPKSLLRHKLAVSSLDDFGKGTWFQKVIPDRIDPDFLPLKVILCSGKIYYDLIENKPNDDRIAIVRIEQLYPFPKEELSKILTQYSTADIIWCQEEPANMGAWTYMYFELKEMGITPTYVGRKPSASPATGYTSVHMAEQSAIINEALKLKRT